MIPRWTPVRRALVLLAMAAIAVLSATAGAVGASSAALS
jgi:hypothetical protein